MGKATLIGLVVGTLLAIFIGVVIILPPSTGLSQTECLNYVQNGKALDAAWSDGVCSILVETTGRWEEVE